MQLEYGTVLILGWAPIHQDEGCMTKKTLKVAIDKRILNEFGSKILNEERLEHIMESRRGTRLSAHSDATFRCECDASACNETIQMSTEEYQRIHHKTKQFVVVPGHVRLDLEKIITAFNNFVLVEKFFPHPNES